MKQKEKRKKNEINKTLTNQIPRTNEAIPQTIIKQLTKRCDFHSRVAGNQEQIMSKL